MGYIPIDTVIDNHLYRINTQINQIESSTSSGDNFDIGKLNTTMAALYVSLVQAKATTLQAQATLVAQARSAEPKRL